MQKGIKLLEVFPLKKEENFYVLAIKYEIHDKDEDKIKMTSFDHNITVKLNMDTWKYKEHLIRYFNGHIYDDKSGDYHYMGINIYFDVEEDCLHAAEWLMSYIISNKLIA